MKVKCGHKDCSTKWGCTRREYGDYASEVRVRPQDDVGEQRVGDVAIGGGGVGPAAGGAGEQGVEEAKGRGRRSDDAGASNAKQGWGRKKYNAYQRDYMRAWRKKQKGGVE